MDSFVELFKEKLATDGKMTPKQKDILQACVELFSEQGFSNTSTSQIAARAKVAEGTIYKHFGTKENLLYVTVLPMFSNLLLQESHKMVPQEAAEGYPERFETLLNQFLFDHFHFFHANYQMLKIFIMEILYQEELRKNLFSLIPVSLVKEINQFLNHYKKAGQIVDWDNQVIIRLIFSNILNYVMLRNTMFPNEVMDDEQQLQYIEIFIIKGLRK